MSSNASALPSFLLSREKKRLLDAEFYKTHPLLTDETLENGDQMKNNNSFIHYSQGTKTLKILCTALIYHRYYNVQSYKTSLDT